MPNQITSFSTLLDPGSKVLDRFSDGTRIVAYNTGTTLNLRTSVDGVTWLDAISGGDCGVAAAGANAAVYNCSIKVDTDNVVWVMYGVKDTATTPNFIVRIARGVSSDRRNFTWTTFQLQTSTTATYTTKWAMVLKVYMEGQEKRVAVAWEHSSAALMFAVIGDNNGTLSAVKATTTIQAAHYGESACVIMDESKNVHAYYFGNSTGSNETILTEKAPYTATDTWGAFTQVTTDITGCNADLGIGAVVIPGTGQHMVVNNSVYALRSEAGVAASILTGKYLSAYAGSGTSAIGNARFGLSTQSALTIDDMGNPVWVYRPTDSTSGYNFSIAWWDRTNNVWLHAQKFSVSTGSQSKIDVSFNPTTRKFDCTYLEGTANPYVFMLDESNATAPTQAFPQVGNLLPLTDLTIKDIQYMPNGDAVLLGRDSTNNWKLLIGQDNGRSWKAPATGGTIPITLAVGSKYSFTTDEDGYVHVLITKSIDQTTGDKLYYFRGALDATRDNITWLTAEYAISINGTTQQISGLEMFAHREGPGWVVHIAWGEDDGDSTTDAETGGYARLPINANGTFGSQARTSLWSSTGFAAGLDWAVFDYEKKMIRIYGGPYTTGGAMNEYYGTYNPPAVPGNFGTWTVGNMGNYTEATGPLAITKTGSKRVRLSATGTGATQKRTILYGADTASGTYPDTVYYPVGSSYVTDLNAVSVSVEENNYIHARWTANDNDHSLQLAKWAVSTKTWGNIRTLGKYVEAIVCGTYFNGGGQLPPGGVARYGASTPALWYGFQAAPNTSPNSPTHTKIDSAGYTLNPRPKFFLSTADLDAADVLRNAQIQVARDSLFNDVVWSAQYGGDSTAYGNATTGWTGLPGMAGDTISWQPQAAEAAALPPGTYYLRARAKDWTDWSLWSATQTFTVSAAPWTDTIPADASGFKAVWLNDLATVVNAARQFRALPTFNFTDGTVASDSTQILGAHITERRAKLGDALSVVGVAPSWTDPAIDTSVDRKGIHINELRTYASQT